MTTLLTNQTYIAGMPALLLRQFFRDVLEPLDDKSILQMFSLSCNESTQLVAQLVQEGYLASVTSTENGTTCAKTALAHDLCMREVISTLPRQDAPAIMLALLREVSLINTSPATAHRVESVTFLGDVLTDTFDRLPFIEAEVKVLPIAVGDRQLQQGLEQLALEFATSHGHAMPTEEERMAWSMKHVRDRILAVSPHLCVRFVQK